MALVHKLRSVVLRYCCAFVMLAAVAEPVAALSCMPLSIAEHVARSHLVFAGTVGDTSGEWAVVNVDRYYKGTGPAKVTVKTDRTWGPFLTRGEQWLLYVTVDEHGIWSPGLCGVSRQISPGQPLTHEEADLLGAGSEPEAGPELPEPSRPALLAWGLAAGVAVGAVLGALRLTAAARGRSR